MVTVRRLGLDGVQRCRVGYLWRYDLPTVSRISHLVGIRLVFAGWTMVAMGLVEEAIADGAELAAEADESSKLDGQA
jgi:hypothetical protein